MINIRTITYNISNKFSNKELACVEKCMEIWKKNKFYIRTSRISTPQAPQSVNIKKYQKLNIFCTKNNIRWFCIPLKISTNKNIDLKKIDKLLNTYDKAFINFDGATNNEINMHAIDNYIKAMKYISFKNNPEKNFRFGICINIKENTPFFPFAKSSGKLSFSIGLELTQEINKIISKNLSCDLNKIRKKIISSLDKQIKAIEKQAIQIEKDLNIEFNGFDFSLAPIIEQDGSIGELISKLGIKNFNGSGTLYITAFLTNILKSFENKYRHIGFSGVMYSLLEDTKLCDMNNTQNIKIEDMIKLSTMCGCGIDMIPIHISEEDNTIKSCILDICAISCRLNKPLGVRFIPFHDKLSYTNLNNDTDFICNTKILSLTSNNILDNKIKKFSLLNLKSTIQ